MRQRAGKVIMRQGVLCLCLILMITGCSISSTGNLTPFSQTGDSYNGGKWSPDGYWFAASVFPDNSIHLFSSDGKLINTVSGCDLSGMGTDFSWTPDGRLSCLSQVAPPMLKLLSLTQEGTVQSSTVIPLPIASGAIDWNFQWNPRHFWFAILAEPSPGSGLSALYIADKNGHELLPPLNVNGAEQLAWSPDGTTLALTEPTGDITLFSIHQSTTGELSLIREQQLHAGASMLGNIAWSPSGRWLVCRHASYSGEDYLFLYATDGSGRQIQITSSTNDGQLDFPAWSPNGKQLIVAHIAIAGNTLMTLDIMHVLQEKDVKP